jgi:hypothetical protein
VEASGSGDFLRASEREIRLYLSYAEANIVRTKVAQMLQYRAAVSRLRSITGGWAFTIQRNEGGTDTIAAIPDKEMTDKT